MVLADGHVETNTLYNWVAPVPEKRRRWNYDNLPHEEDWPNQNPDDWKNIPSAMNNNPETFTITFKI